jgi:hypothetical protein
MGDKSGGKILGSRIRSHVNEDSRNSLHLLCALLVAQPGGPRPACKGVILGVYLSEREKISKNRPCPSVEIGIHSHA